MCFLLVGYNSLAHVYRISTDSVDFSHFSFYQLQYPVRRMSTCVRIPDGASQLTGSVTEMMIVETDPMN